MQWQSECSWDLIRVLNALSILNERYRIDEDEPDGLQPVPSPGQQLHESAEFLGFLDADK
ncbi:hypothetical protein V6000_009913 [Aspergillus fumigatus]